VPALSDVQSYQASVDDVSTLTIAELLRFWRGLDVADAVPSAVAVREFLPELVDAYAPLSAEVAASFYDDTRAAANAPGSFLADLAPARSVDKLQRMISWAVAPLFRVDPKTELAAPDPVLGLSRLSSGTQLEIADSARDTIDLNIEADQDLGHPRFARHASANACAFCALMATRGAVFRTAESAGSGHKYHAHCHCVAYPVFPGEDDESPDYVLGWERAYRDARKAARKSGIKSPGLKDVLPFMRQSLGAA
jgi:hypothetical protein